MIAKGSRVRIMRGAFEGHQGTVLDEVGSGGFSLVRGGPSVRVRLDGPGTPVSVVAFDLKEFLPQASVRSGPPGATTEAL